jgi:amino acid transporter
MNVWSVAALGIGAMVGAGIFALLGQVAPIAGSETYVSFLIGGGIAALSGYSYAKLAARYPDSGGVSEYFDEAFGVGRLAGALTLIYLVTLAVTAAMVARTFGAYAAPLPLKTSDPIWVGVFGSAILLLLTVLNLAGRQMVGRMELFLVAIKLVILTGLMVAGLMGAHAQPLSGRTEPSLYGIFASVGVTFFAYAGYGMMANAAGSVSNPAQTVPRAIYLAIAVVAVVVLQSISPANLAAHADTALAEAARPVFGHFGYVIVSVAALLATASAINATLFSAIRIAAALADTGRLPAAFKPWFWRNGSSGVVVSVAGILLATNFLHLGAIADIASATFLIAYIAVQVAHWRLSQETGGSRTLICSAPWRWRPCCWCSCGASRRPSPGRLESSPLSSQQVLSSKSCRSGATRPTCQNRSPAPLQRSSSP